VNTTFEVAGKTYPAEIVSRSFDGTYRCGILPLETGLKVQVIVYGDGNDPEADAHAFLFDPNCAYPDSVLCESSHFAASDIPGTLAEWSGWSLADAKAWADA
jgi:hypothetical protein